MKRPAELQLVVVERTGVELNGGSPGAAADQHHDPTRRACTRRRSPGLRAPHRLEDQRVVAERGNASGAQRRRLL